MLNWVETEILWTQSWNLIVTGLSERKLHKLSYLERNLEYNFIINLVWTNVSIKISWAELFLICFRFYLFTNYLNESIEKNPQPDCFSTHFERKVDIHHLNFCTNLFSTENFRFINFYLINNSPSGFISFDVIKNWSVFGVHSFKNMRE